MNDEILSSQGHTIQMDGVGIEKTKMNTMISTLTSKLYMTNTFQVRFMSLSRDIIRSEVQEMSSSKIDISSDERDECLETFEIEAKIQERTPSIREITHFLRKIQLARLDKIIERRERRLESFLDSIYQRRTRRMLRQVRNCLIQSSTNRVTSNTKEHRRYQDRQEEEKFVFHVRKDEKGDKIQEKWILWQEMLVFFVREDERDNTFRWQTSIKPYRNGHHRWNEN